MHINSIFSFGTFIFLLFLQSNEAKGLSKKIMDRFTDYVAEQRVPCEMPAITEKLPTRIRAKIEQIWSEFDGSSSDCWIEMAQTRNALLHLKNSEKWMILRKEAKECVNSVEKVKNFEKMKKDKECWDRQKNARILLLNLPAGYKFHPPTFECALPHFYNRLENSLQEKLREIWSGYKRGSCVEQIDKQIQLLEANDISLKSFQMPPPSMFRKREIRRKLRRRANVA